MAICPSYPPTTRAHIGISTPYRTAPGDQPQYRLEWDGNGFSGDVSADAAGLIATLFMLGHMHEKYGEDQFAQLYAWASAYAAQHSEAGPIGAALD